MNGLSIFTEDCLFKKQNQTAPKNVCLHTGGRRVDLTVALRSGCGVYHIYLQSSWEKEKESCESVRVPVLIHF